MNKINKRLLRTINAYCESARCRRRQPSTCPSHKRRAQPLRVGTGSAQAECVSSPPTEGNPTRLEVSARHVA
eukprot:747622-Prorocentrum_minimum.AAC.1